MSDRYAAAAPLVLALPRGGVPVAAKIAGSLRAPLDVFIVRKLGAPGRPELAVGAIAGGNVQVVDREALARLHIDERTFAAILNHERDELQRRELAYRAGRQPLALSGRAVILVDDGLATGASMFAAILAVRSQHPKHLAVAVPVAPRETAAQVAAQVDTLVCAATPEPFTSVGAFYADFAQVSDEEVRKMLA